jgi:hypothetical protein
MIPKLHAGLVISVEHVKSIASRCRRLCVHEWLDYLQSRSMISLGSGSQWLLNGRDAAPRTRGARGER